MKVLVAAGGVPNPTTSGGALTAWSAIEALRHEGHQVVVAAIDDLHQAPSARGRAERVEALEALGARVILVDGAAARPIPPRGRLAAMLDTRLETYFPTATLAPVLERILRAERPDAVFAYHWEPLAAVYRQRLAPVVAGVGDPAHLPAYFRWRETPPRPTRAYAALSFATAKALLRLPAHMRTLLTPCAAKGAFAAHHAAWLRGIGVPDCAYFRTPVVDSVGSAWAEHRARLAAERGDPARARVLLIGHLKGTATLSGLSLFSREVLPRLEQALGPRLEVRVVGGHTPPADLRRLLDRPSVVMCGQVEPADDEFLGSDVLLVPTPIRLGIRVRILTGFSFGSCVVAHRANAEGIPEMEHERNALLADDGPGLAAQVLRAIEDRPLRGRLEAAARATYEAHFSPAAAGGAIAAALRAVASPARPVQALAHV